MTTIKDNAYVSGLKDDLGFEGNQLVELQTMYTVGAVVGQLPFMFLFTYVPMNWTIPLLDICWGIFTLLQYRATSFAEMAAYRFLVGWFEAAFFPAIHYVLGAWYRGDEISRRGGIYHSAMAFGTITAGLIQAGATSSLHGVDGLAGWRWMYIICAVITIPIGIVGFFVLPGTPEMPNRFLLSQAEIDQAAQRLKRAGHSITGRFQWRVLKELAAKWQFWALVWLDIFYWNGSINTSAGGFLLWLKSLDRYSTAMVNELGTIAPALGIFYILLTCFASDLFLGPAWAITASEVWNITGLVILVIWRVPEPALWLAFATTYSAIAMSSVLYGWVNHQLRGTPAGRAFTLVLINVVSQSTTAFTPLLVFPTVEAPRFTKGYAFVLGNGVCLVALAHVIRVLLRREEWDGSRAEGAESAMTDAEEPRGTSGTTLGEPCMA